MHLPSTILAVTVVAGLTASTADTSNWKLAQFFGQRCQTAQGWCFMAAPGPVGTQCFCPTPFGPVGGIIIQ